MLCEPGDPADLPETGIDLSGNAKADAGRLWLGTDASRAGE